MRDAELRDKYMEIDESITSELHEIIKLKLLRELATETTLSNSLHLIRELYDNDILREHTRIYLLTEKPYEDYRGRWLIPQEPYPKKKTWVDVVKKNR